MVTSTMPDSVHRLVESHRAAMSFVPAEQVSLRADTEATFGKTLLIAAGSYFEALLSRAVYDVFMDGTGGTQALADFVWGKAVTRRYHDWFDWDRRNANKFFGAFGSGFQSHMKERIEKTPGLEDAIRSFMEIGSLRNVLAHDDLASYSLNKTVQEIFELYERALGFVETFPSELRSYIGY